MSLITTIGSASVRGFGRLSAASELFPFTSHTFTPGGAVGRDGPSLGTLRSAYGTSWSLDTAFFNVTGSYGGIQLFTVPKTGIYAITAQGARGGGATAGDGAGAYSAKAEGRISLLSGQVLAIVCGQAGKRSGTGSNYYNAGGGGGSFVYAYATSTLYVAAGGGGGLSDSNASLVNSDPMRGQTTNSGGAGTNNNGSSTGGSGGSGGGRGSQGGYGYNAGAGAGFNTGGNEIAHSACSDYPQSVTSGAGINGGFRGGFGWSSCQLSIDGGFGGGGGGSGACCSSGSGGGGGYSGGGVGYECCSSNGGGGGSYVNPSMTNININTGYTGSNGFVIIEAL